MAGDKVFLLAFFELWLFNFADFHTMRTPVVKWATFWRISWVGNITCQNYPLALMCTICNWCSRKQGLRIGVLSVLI